MTVAEAFHDKPFAMLNWHRNWCENQKQHPFCFSEGALAGEFKNDWKNCPNRTLCFVAFINSDASKEKGCTENDK